jgi:hypothetical protein
MTTVIKQLPTTPPMKQTISKCMINTLDSKFLYSNVELEKIQAYETCIYSIPLKSDKTHFIYSLKTSEQADIINHLISCNDMCAKIYVHNTLDCERTISVDYIAY